MTAAEKKAITLDLLSKAKVSLETMMTKEHQGADYSIDQFYFEMYSSQAKSLKQQTVSE